MPWIEQGSVIKVRQIGNTINVCFNTVGVTCYLSQINLEEGEAVEAKKYYEKHNTVMDAEFYDAVSYYLRTH